MANVWTDEKLRHAITFVALRAYQDAAFRYIALTNAEEALRQVSGIAPPYPFEIKFVEGGDFGGGGFSIGPGGKDRYEVALPNAGVDVLRPDFMAKELTLVDATCKFFPFTNPYVNID